MRYLKLFTLLMLIVLTDSVTAKATDVGSLVSWGAIAFDSRELDANDFIAVSAGLHYCLALKFDGSIIDFETAGNFLPEPGLNQYRKLQHVAIGILNCTQMQVFALRGDSKAHISALREVCKNVLNEIPRPFYAFNSEFERSVLFYELGKEIAFDGELQEGRESKANACRYLGIPNYDDPFYDRGVLCMQAWQDGEFDKAIAHNRACLLKERDILIKRRFRRPNELRFVK